MTVLRETVSWRKKRATGRGTALTPTEQANVRRALRALREREGSSVKLARAIGMSVGTIAHGAGKATISAQLAVRLARLARVPVSDVLVGAWPPGGRCPTCGRLGPDSPK